MGGMSLVKDSDSKITLQVEMYFSIVRLSPAWACLLSRSASLITTHLNLQH
jgi:hypothetical protein